MTEVVPFLPVIARLNRAFIGRVVRTLVRDYGIRSSSTLALACPHFVPDEADPGAAIGRFRDAMAPGSFLVISHGTLELGATDERIERPTLRGGVGRLNG